MYFGIVGSGWSIMGKYVGNLQVKGSIHEKEGFSYLRFSRGNIGYG
jgi:hypothetical protein